MVAMNLTVRRDKWPMVSSFKFQMFFALILFCTYGLMIFFGNLSTFEDFFFFSLVLLSSFLGYISMIALCAVRANSLKQSPTLIIAIGLWLLFSFSLSLTGRSFGFLSAEQITLFDGIKKVSGSALLVYIVFLSLPWPIKAAENGDDIKAAL
jgi:hypothetical protein